MKKLHQSFIEAGSDLILTNTFGGTRYRLKLHGAEGRVKELNRRAAELAREEADSAGRPGVVAGSMGPTGELIEPLGQLSFNACTAAYAPTFSGSRPCPRRKSSRQQPWVPRMQACPLPLRSASTPMGAR